MPFNHLLGVSEAHHHEDTLTQKHADRLFAVFSPGASCSWACCQTVSITDSPPAPTRLLCLFIFGSDDTFNYCQLHFGSTVIGFDTEALCKSLYPGYWSGAG